MQAGVLALALACAQRDPAVPYALVLVIDGVRTDELTSPHRSTITGVSGEEWAAEAWDELAPRAAVVRSALNTGVPTTAPAHAALLTGRSTSYANYPAPGARPGPYLPDVPTLLDEASAQLGLGADGAVLLANTELLSGVASTVGGGGRFVYIGDARGPAITDEPVFDAIRAAIDDGPPRVLIANLHGADRAGHFGDDGDYEARVQEAQSAIAELARWLQRRHPVYWDHVMLMVTSDHGRHREETADAWRSHGDDCRGCREVPLFVVGGGARAGTIGDGPWGIDDLAPTLAEHLGIDLPFGRGLPLSPLVDGLGGGRSGELLGDVDGDLRGTRRWTDRFERRAEVWVDGSRLSDLAAHDADAVTVARGDGGDLACFRELVLDESADTWPWAARCLWRRDGPWEEVGFLSGAPIGPGWSADITALPGGTFAVAWVENVETTADFAEGVGLGLATWSPEDGWGPRVLASTVYPSEPAVAWGSGGVVAAVATGLSGDEARFERLIRVYDGFGGERASFGAELYAPEGRAERPALDVDGDRARLAWVVSSAEGTALAWGASEDGGASWGEPALVPGSDGAVMHLTPVWEGDDLVWIDVQGGEARRCASQPPDLPNCVPLGSPRADGLGRGWVTVDRGVGAWETLRAP